MYSPEVVFCRAIEFVFINNHFLENKNWRMGLHSSYKFWTSSCLISSILSNQKFHWLSDSPWSYVRAMFLWILTNRMCLFFTTAFSSNVWDLHWQWRFKTRILRKHGLLKLIKKYKRGPAYKIEFQMLY